MVLLIFETRYSQLGIGSSLSLGSPAGSLLQRSSAFAREKSADACSTVHPVRVSRGTEPCDGVEQKTCLSGASLFCVRHRVSTGVCLRSRPNGIGARGSPEGCRVTPLWARPARTRTSHGAMTYQRALYLLRWGHDHYRCKYLADHRPCLKVGIMVHFFKEMNLGSNHGLPGN